LEVASEVIKAYRGGLTEGTEQTRVLSEKLGLAEDAIRGYFALLHEADVPTEEAYARLKEMALRHRDLMLSAAKLELDDPETKRLRDEALRAIKAGPTSFAEADALLEEAERRETWASDDVRRTADARLLNAASVRAQRGELARTRLDFFNAAQHFYAAYAMAKDASEPTAFGYSKSYAFALFEHGDRYGDAAALAASVLNLLRMRERLEHDLHHESTVGDSADWADIMYALGSALRRMGEYDPGELAHALSTFTTLRAAYSPETSPLGWALAQESVGTTLLSMGERETGTTTLREAVSSLRAAHDVSKCHGDHALAASAMTNLASALKALGERGSDSITLREALDADYEALGAIPEGAHTRDGAIIRVNIGSILTRLGEREAGTSSLESGAASYRTALQMLTEDDDPIHWASIQNNLGRTLWLVATRTHSESTLRESLFAFDLALRVRTRNRAPNDWAITQNNRGNALSTLAQITGTTEPYREAIRCFRNALLEHTREHAPASWSLAMNNLGNALSWLGAEEKRLSMLREATLAYRNALLEQSIEHQPFDWAMTQNNLGSAFARLAQEGETSAFADAAAAYSQALRVYNSEDTPLYWASTNFNLGQVLLSTVDIGNVEVPCAVLIAFCDALSVREFADNDQMLTLIFSNMRQAVTRVYVDDPIEVEQTLDRVNQLEKYWTVSAQAEQQLDEMRAYFACTGHPRSSSPLGVGDSPTNRSLRRD
jgi:hypothetical protein